MEPQFTEAQWAAMRAIREGRLQSFTRLSAISGQPARKIRGRAQKEGWGEPPRRRKRVADNGADDHPGGAGLPNGAPLPWHTGESGETDEASASPSAEVKVPGAPLQDASPTATAEPPLPRLADLLAREVEKLLKAAQGKRGLPSKARMDTVWSLVRMVEKAGALAAERATENQMRSDAELAAMLRRIDERIVELAHGHAARLGGGECREAVG